VKEYTVEIDGQPRLLKYRLQDRETIEAMFPRPDGSPASLAALVRGHLFQSGSIAVQTAMVWAGLRHLGNKWTVERVSAAMDAASQNGGIKKLTDAVREAIVMSGVLGSVPDIEDDEEDEEGKAEGPGA